MLEEKAQALGQRLLVLWLLLLFPFLTIKEEPHSIVILHILYMFL